MSNEKMVRISATIPPKLLKEFDEIIEKIGIDRSKAIQNAIRSFLNEYKPIFEKEGFNIGSIILIYDHKARGLEEKLTDIQHDFSQVINSTMHIHLDENNCLEIIAVKGELKIIEKLSKTLLSLKGVKQVKLALISTKA